MRVLVTRPEPGATHTAGLLRARGHEPVLLPLTRTVAITASAPALRGGRPAAYVVTSAAALRHWAALGFAPEQLRTPLYAVGVATGEAARSAGFADVRIGAGDGEALAARLIADAAGGRIALSGDALLLYVAGRVRRSRFGDLLQSAKMPFNTVEIYDTEEISYSTDFLSRCFSMDRPVAVLLYSRNAASILFDKLLSGIDDKPLQNNVFLCMSDYVSAAVPHRFADRVFVAAAPNETDLLKLLESFSDLG